MANFKKCALCSLLRELIRLPRYFKVKTTRWKTVNKICAAYSVDQNGFLAPSAPWNKYYFCLI